ncbi:hypothetical protein Calkr_0674 [Caldicellulosiruptor acetigenus I77R1B]|uniref:Uncharacterized protein n=1 Tax=Caldicellulosiruptor acetigenus (strain ATCC 700853 / DSM 12137 / I77R1B) TaxID=632335 RepID=E4SAK1_CALA7|nr:hypothetical protein [Caldicellulosiruptor acetigenus]ADQ40210.1 hypothetical protein Calkr_0674 [Caldicellulosiruptor acetigenus I77R1B]
MGKLSLDKLEEWAYQFANKFLEISEEPESVYLADMNGESVAIVLKDQYPGAKYITREIYGKMVWKKTDERTKFKVIKLPEKNDISVRIRGEPENERKEIWEFGYSSNFLASKKPLFRFFKTRGCGELIIETQNIDELKSLEETELFGKQMEEILNKLDCIGIILGHLKRIM